MTSIIIGFLGEVGSALKEVLNPDAGVDVNGNSFGLGAKIYDIMHICIPYSEKFKEQVNAYQSEYNPKYTIIHSTVPVGTSRACGAIHSPIRGIHPNLVSGIRTFPKFLGGEEASAVADHFRRAGLRVFLFDSPEATEAGKLFDTEYYRTCIEFTHRVYRFCAAKGLNFHEVYTLFNQTYNEGYAQLGHPEFVRPVLQPIMTEIGGHCLLPNQKIIINQEEEIK